MTTKYWANEYSLLLGQKKKKKMHATGSVWRRALLSTSSICISISISIQSESSLDFCVNSAPVDLGLRPESSTAGFLVWSASIRQLMTAGGFGFHAARYRGEKRPEKCPRRARYKIKLSPFHRRTFQSQAPSSKDSFSGFWNILLAKPCDSKCASSRVLGSIFSNSEKRHHHVGCYHRHQPGLLQVRRSVSP